MKYFLALLVLLAAPAVALAQELPRATPDATYRPNTGAVLSVPAGGNLQAALDAAQPGDTVELAAGASWTGNFVLRPKSGTGVIIIRTSTPDAELPAPGTRATPADAPKMARILTATPQAAIQTTGLASNYRLVGLEFSVSPSLGQAWQYGLVAFGVAGTPQLTAADAPENLVLDRCYLHGTTDSQTLRGVALNSRTAAIVDCYFADFHCDGADSQAICGWNGPGPFLVQNNYLEGAGENVMFGGSDSKSDSLVPADVTFRRNDLVKPEAWRTYRSLAGKLWVVKNLFELKSARRILVDGNHMTRSWAGGQYGAGIVVKSANQGNNAPWGNTEDATITNNTIDLVEEGAHFIGRDGNGNLTSNTRRVKFSNNLFTLVSNKRAFYVTPGSALKDSTGAILDFSSVDDLEISHNTVYNTNTSIGTLITLAGRITVNGVVVYGTADRFVFTDNICGHGRYGIIGDTEGTGLTMQSHFVPGAVITQNVVVGGASAASQYPAGNLFPATWTDVGFTDLTNGDFTVASGPYVGYGADTAAIAAAYAPPVVTPPPPPPDQCATDLATAEARIADLESQLADAQAAITARDAQIVAAQAEIDRLRAAIAQALAVLQGVE